MAMIAYKCPEIQVVVVDINQARIDAWNQMGGCELPIYEPGLEEVVQAARGRNLFFSSDTHKHVAEGDIIFVRRAPARGAPGRAATAAAAARPAWAAWAARGGAGGRRERGDLWASSDPHERLGKPKKKSVCQVLPPVQRAPWPGLQQALRQPPSQGQGSSVRRRPRASWGRGADAGAAAASRAAEAWRARRRSPLPPSCSAPPRCAGPAPGAARAPRRPLSRSATARSVNTPTKTRGVGAGKAADLTYWEGAARMIASVSTTSKIVVEKSTVPVKTAEAIEKARARPLPRRGPVREPGGAGRACGQGSLRAGVALPVSSARRRRGAGPRRSGACWGLQIAAGAGHMPGVVLSPPPFCQATCRANGAGWPIIFPTYRSLAEQFARA